MVSRMKKPITKKKASERIRPLHTLDAERRAVLEKAARLRETEQELQQFLSGYYAAIGEHIEALFALEDAKTAWLSQHMPTMQCMQQRVDIAADETRTTLLKNAYRQAARNAHPDVQSAEADRAYAPNDTMMRVNRAREEGDIATLIATAMQHTTRDETLGHEELKRWNHALDESMEALLSSPAYALYLKAFEAKLAGRNWLEDTTQTLKRVIAIESRAAAKEGVRAIAQLREEWRDVRTSAHADGKVA